MRMDTAWHGAGVLVKQAAKSDVIGRPKLAHFADPTPQRSRDGSD